MRTQGPGESALLLFDAVAVLAREKIDYAVIGAMAASIHGVVRASVDADAVLFIPAQQSTKLQETFKAAGFSTQLRRGDMDDPIAALLDLSDSHGNRVDLLIGLRGLESAAFSRTIEVAFHGETLRVIGREDFIAMKLFAGGPQDIVDARRALAVTRDSLDMTLLERLVKQYGREAANSLRQLLSE